MINRVVLIGRLTKDPDLRKTQTGKSVTSFPIAVDRMKRKDQEVADTDFITCQAWNKTAEYICSYAKKGTLIGVDGRIQTRNYDNAAGQKVYITEVVCESVSLLFGYGNRNITPDKDPRTAGYAGAQNAMSGYDYSSGSTLEISSDDLPF
ncbi:single-stranded DNA-binding protein [Holdemania massiliensis]|uniref:single-stranded DNA-binding protein n=1 Tax=Holdemania massiliensis TaxID=1468449 RepID=UPI0035659914